MHTATKIRSSFEESIAHFHASPALQALAGGRVTLEHYKAILREIYHYSKEDPQIQALATVYFRGDDRDSVKMFLKHAISEIGHDRLALADLEALGEDVADVPLTNPLPTTLGLTAFPFYQVQYANPVGYLGYLYFLEHMPTAAGRSYAEGLRRAGVPDNALGFLHEHTTVDVAHNKLMDEYIQRLVRTEADLDAVCYAIEVTGDLYALMLQGAIEDAVRPRRRGVRHEETVRVVSRASPIAASVAA
jgi:pyrroloquinoline quinone (PQQ) biosynthesis protein C